jgi:hypothetical protein
MARDIPLTEFDADSAALIDPEAVSTSGEVPERAVICFFRDVIDEVCGDGRAQVVATFAWEHGSHQLFSLQVGDPGWRCSILAWARRWPAACSNR